MAAAEVGAPTVTALPGGAADGCQMKAPRVHIAMSVRDEAPYILEWVAYYRSIGATDISVFYNDCSDGTARMLARLQEMGLVLALRNPPDPAQPHKSPQRLALDRLRAMPTVLESDWFAFLDIDEFLNVLCGDRTFGALVDAVGDGVDAISINWKMFGSSGHLAMQDAPVTTRFRRAGTWSPAGAIRQFKTLHRPGRFRGYRIHHPTLFSPGDHRNGEIVWVSGSGRRMTMNEIENGCLLDESVCGTKLAQINHYAVRSREEFVRLRSRGSGTGNVRRFGWEYWHKADLNDEVDRSVSTSGMLALLEELKSDAMLRKIHARSHLIHRERVARSREDPLVARFLDGADPPPLPPHESASSLGPAPLGPGAPGG